MVTKEKKKNPKSGLGEPQPLGGSSSLFQMKTDQEAETQEKEPETTIQTVAEVKPAPKTAKKQQKKVGSKSTKKVSKSSQNKSEKKEAKSKTSTSYALEADTVILLNELKLKARINEGRFVSFTELLDRAVRKLAEDML